MRAEILDRQGKNRQDKTTRIGWVFDSGPRRQEMRESRGKLSGAWCAKLRLLLATALGISLYSFHLKSLSLSFFSHTCVCVYLSLSLSPVSLSPVSLSPHSYCPSNLSVGGLGRNRQWTGLHMTPLYLSMYALRLLFGVCMCTIMHYISLYTLMLLAAPHALDSPPYIYPNLACAPACFYRERKRVYKAFRIYLSFFFLPLRSFLLQSDR